MLYYALSSLSKPSHYCDPNNERRRTTTIFCWLDILVLVGGWVGVYCCLSRSQSYDSPRSPRLLSWHHPDTPPIRFSDTKHRALFRRALPTCLACCLLSGGGQRFDGSVQRRRDQSRGKIVGPTQASHFLAMHLITLRHKTHTHTHTIRWNFVKNKVKVKKGKATLLYYNLHVSLSATYAQLSPLLHYGSNHLSRGRSHCQVGAYVAHIHT
jgi:hypothetical protein